jgi:uncharacterized caspase-like protein
MFFFTGCGFDAGGKKYLATFDTVENAPAASALSIESVIDSLRTVQGRVLWIDAARPLPPGLRGITP